MPDNLAGKVALVTGSSRGLGAAIAVKLGQHGAKIAINYFHDDQKQGANKVKDIIVAAGGHADIFVGDITDDADVSAICHSVRHKLGDIDILVVNATGPQPTIAIEDLSWDAMLQQLHFFVKSPMLLIKQVVTAMKQKNYGRIIHIGSEVFDSGMPQKSHYVSAKGAQLGLMRSWSQELASFQITVNLVAPGWVPTERHANDPEEPMIEYTNNIPMKHMGEADDVAEAVLFLASDSAKFITGQRISVNGGNTMT